MLKENDAARETLNVNTWHNAGYTGKGVTIVLIDIEGKARENMRDYFFDPLNTQKEVGHASNVGFTAHEFAPDVRVLAFRSRQESFDWIAAHKDDVDIINVSMSGMGTVPVPIFSQYEKLGIPLICSSSNDYYDDKIAYPAAYPFTIAIGATNRDGNKAASYSNGGATLDAVALGIVYVQGDDGRIWPVKGTSFATPMVTGMLACYIQWRKERGVPTLAPEEARKFIHENCKDIEEEGFDLASGHGLFCLPEIVPEKEDIMPRIYISPSTQEQNKGLSPFTNEEEMMGKIADELIYLLKKDDRFLTRRNATYMEPYTIASDSNVWKADLHVAIHSNAGGGQGTEVYAYGPGTNSEKLAKALYAQIAPLSPGTDRGVKFNKGLIEVGDAVKATSCLIELGFHDNQKDAIWLAYNHEMIADRLYRGICDYYGYKYMAVAVAAVVGPPAVPVVDKKAQAIALIEQGLKMLKG